VTDSLFAASAWFAPNAGPRYLQFARHLEAAILRGALAPGAQLPPERRLAELAGISRVTLRKSVERLAQIGLVEQRRGAGCFVRGGADRTEQSLSQLVSFSENLAARGRRSTSRLLQCSRNRPNPEEMLALGLGPSDSVSRIKRLRYADDQPMAVELSSLPTDVLPDPAAVGQSLYAVLRAANTAPSRAIQKVGAECVDGELAALLGLPAGSAALRIDRTGFLDTGRPVEFTRGHYRSDTYDFVVELRPGEARATSDG